MPKPSPTTETCSNHFEQREVNSGKGFPSASARASPKASARGGEAEYAEARIPTTKAALLAFFNNQDISTDCALLSSGRRTVKETTKDTKDHEGRDGSFS